MALSDPVAVDFDVGVVWLDLIVGCLREDSCSVEWIGWVDFGDEAHSVLLRTYCAVV